jgi:hypothetical protein
VLSGGLNDQICVLADHILSSLGTVVVSGVGKSRIVVFCVHLVVGLRVQFDASDSQLPMSLPHKAGRKTHAL